MKLTAIVGVAAAIIGALVGTQIPGGVVSGPVSITTFKIEIPFEEWAAGFDSKEVDKMHKSNYIKPMFRGVSSDDPSQVVVIHESEEGVAEKFLFDNREMIEASGHIMRTTRTSNWSFQ